MTDPASTRASGLAGVGVTNMRDRVGAIGGSLTIASSPRERDDGLRLDPAGRNDTVPPALRVLVADDQAPFRNAARAVLEIAQDFEVVGEVTSGEEAVDAAVTLRPDLVVMDVKMDGIGGIEATRQILAIAAADGRRARVELPVGGRARAPSRSPGRWPLSRRTGSARRR